MNTYFILLGVWVSFGFLLNKIFIFETNKNSLIKKK